MSDDHSTNAISAYQSRLASVMSTPNIDRIASEGILLNNCFSTNSICTPSRASILSGQYSHVNGVKTLRDDYHPNSQQPDLPQILQKQGYQTAIFGKWHLHTEPVGFDQWQVLPSQGLYFDPEFKTKGYDTNTPYADRAMKKLKGYVTDIITDLSLDWLKKRDENKPFMLMVHQKAPHALWEYHPKYKDLYKDVTIPEPKSLFEDKSHRAPETITKENTLVRLGKRMAGEMKISTVHKYDEWPTGKLDLTGMNEKERIKATYQKYVKDYLRVIASVDENVGRVLDYLDESGLADNTIVIYTSDQGMFLGEHQYLDKRWIFEESIKMPFLIRWPNKLKSAQKVDELVANVDIAPTLLDMAGIDKPEYMQGNSFVSVLNGETEGWQKSVYYRYWMHRDMTPAHYGIRTKQYKLIYYYGKTLDTNSYGHPDTEPAWELYDLARDPQEMNNVYNDPAYETVIKKLKQQLEEKQKEVGDKMVKR
ncbi:DUF4976 domain-containing protein [Puteibacter caeruleilacunae]|nr:DUF4976 domain-containing protein [Puteibacter caeruleilacunae]